MTTPLLAYEKIPSIKYDRSTDPDDHLLAFKSQMDIYDTPEAVICRLFPTSFFGTATKW